MFYRITEKKNEGVETKKERQGVPKTQAAERSDTSHGEDGGGGGGGVTAVEAALVWWSTGLESEIEGKDRLRKYRV